MDKRWIVGIVALVSVTSCTQVTLWTSTRWTGQGSAPATPPGVSNENSLPIGQQELLLETQKIEGVEVEGSYYKKISEKGQAEFIDYRWMSAIPLSVRRDLLLMRAQKPFVLSYFLKSHEQFSRDNLIEGPSLSIPWIADEEPQVLWKMIFEEADGTLQGVYVDYNMEIVLQRRLGSGFIDATAHIFPNGPLKSQLQKVVIQGLLNNKELSTTQIKLSTEADTVAQPGENNELNFAVTDVRFSQVQVFFYMNQALQWAEKTLQVKLPFVLEAETQKGFPDKTNTAFYFQQKIRLGEGDGDTFEKIPMDPSIVTHETMHAVIQAVAGLPYEKQGGSLNEAFADFLTAVQLNNPRMGEASYKKAPFKRTVENDMQFAEVNGGLYHDSGIISGLLWALQKQLGKDQGLEIAWKTLLRLNYFSDFESFKKELLEVSSKETPETQKIIRDEMKKRGWDL
ncbi:MAG: hypothetical protein JSU04_08660 [Bdellovibrionales bacterium]|nr:hypothetical protein [Bdellovibrionales bacterium]